MSSEDEEDRTMIVGDFKHGSIRRIKLRNFLTYSNVECLPGPRLNMVVGPNGTGLGGEPRLLGRASDIETFVMNGEDEAMIEIEIVSETGDNPVVKRIIRRNPSNKTPKTSYYLNNSPVPAKQVRAMVLEDYHISVDNLCTFLPQDRVGSFSGFDSKALLIETEKSLDSEQDLYQTHQDLIEAQEDLNSGDVNVEPLQELVGQLQNKKQRLEREKTRMEERERALEEAKLFSCKLAWLRFDEAKDNCINTREERKNAKLKKKELEEEIGPMREQHNEALERLRRIETRYKTLNQQVDKQKKEMEKQITKFDNHDEKMEETLIALRAQDSQRAQDKEKVEQLREKLHSLTESAKDYSSLEELEEQHRLAQKEHIEKRPKFDEAKRNLRVAEGELRELQDDHKNVQTKMKKLQDDKARRKDRIFRQQPKLHDVYKWVDKNRSMFRKQIWGPIVCEVTPKSKNAAAYLEQHVPNALLKSFIVEDKDDYDLLYQNVREKLKLPVNVVLVKNGQLLPAKPRPYSNDKMNILKKEHGVVGYMDESFTAPDAVLQALKTGANVASVLVGTQETQNSLDDKKLLEYLHQGERGQNQLQSCCIFACEGDKSFKYQSSISKYSGKPSTRVDEIKAATWLAPGTNEDAKQKVQEELDNLERGVKDAHQKVETARESLEATHEVAQAASARLKEAKADLDLVKKLVMKIKGAERKLKDAEKKLETDDEEEKKQHISILRNRVTHSITALETHAQSHRVLMETTYKVAGVRMDKDKVSSEERQTKLAMQDKQTELEEATRQYDRCDKTYKREVEKVRELKQKAQDEAPLVDEEGRDTPLKGKLEDIPLETVAEAEAALEEAQNKASEIEADDDVFRQYENVSRELEDKQAQLEELTGSRERKLEEIDKRRAPWEAALTNSVAKVNVLFARYMSELGYTGEVNLSKGGDQSSDDPDSMSRFKDWGIQIKVSFREGVKAQVLSARVQSGGERSVSTIMYLMALQGLMGSPFRCVDEINQGLDERNERMVFKRIVENSTQPPKQNPTDHCGQYFLITPKLLPNLYDMEEEAMTVHFIFNGPYSFKSPSDWDVSHFINLRKRQAADSDGDEGQESHNNRQGAIPKRPKVEADSEEGE